MRARVCFGATVALLTAFNVARALGAFGSLEVAAAVGLTGALGLIAWRCGLDADQLGLGRRDLGRGAAYGVAVSAVVLGLVVAAAAIPATSGFLHDSRADISASRLLVEVTVVLLLGTVVPEELAFRGVLLAAGTVPWGQRRAVLASSALFGLWHIAPTLHTAAGNSRLAGPTASVAGMTAAVAGSVAVTFVGGLVFCWLRVRSRSLLAPVIAHLSTNGVALVVAWIVTH